SILKSSAFLRGLRVKKGKRDRSISRHQSILGKAPVLVNAGGFFCCAPFASCHIPLSLHDPIVQWPRTLPFHGSNTGSNPVRVAVNHNYFLTKKLYVVFSTS